MWIKSNLKLKLLLIHLGYLGKNLAQKNFIFCASNLNKHVFHKKLDVFFFKYSNVHGRNTLLIDNSLFKNFFNGPYNVVFVETFDSSIGNNNNYLLRAILPYLEAL